MSPPPALVPIPVANRLTYPMLDHQRLIAARIAGARLEWHGGRDSRTIDAFLAQASYHGALPLLDAQFRLHGDAAAWPERIPAACARAYSTQTGYERLHRAEIRKVLEALAEVSVTPLMLKGTALAYGLYQSPSLRPRADTDLLVAPEKREAAARALQALGHVRITGPAGDFVGYQMQLKRHDALGVVHNLDLHWRISNAQSFAWLFSFEDLIADAVPVARLDSRGLRLGNVHALVLSLLHRAGSNLFEQPGLGDRLIWLYDMHLLVSNMSAAELERLRAMVESRRVGAIALEGLRRCAERFPTSCLSDLIDTLAGDPGVQSGADLLRAGRLRREWIEFRAMPATPRLAYLAERAFPSREYMRERYPEAAARSLPRLHAKRWLEGLGKLVRAARSG